LDRVTPRVASAAAACLATVSAPSSSPRCIRRSEWYASTRSWEGAAGEREAGERGAWRREGGVGEEREWEGR
jgi:hypothetical protein